MIKKVCKLRVFWKLAILNVNLDFQRPLLAKYWWQSSSLNFRPRYFVKVSGKPYFSSIWPSRSEIWLKNLQIFTFLKNLNVNLDFQRPLLAKYWWQSSSLLFRLRYSVKVLEKPYFSTIWPIRREIWLKNLQIFTFLKNLNVNLDFQRPLLAKYSWQSSSLMFHPRYFVKVWGKPYFSSI